jgi:Bardet-Biedl syndrome 5 protein
MEDLWQDREVEFDVSAARLRPRRGEAVVDELGSVEDTKSGLGERGQLTLTGLRLTWQSHSRRGINVSVGLGCVTSVATKTATSRLRGGTTQALVVQTRGRSGGERGASPGGGGGGGGGDGDAEQAYEFIFTSLVKASPRLFALAASALRAYGTTRLYRDLKMRSAIVQAKELLLLPGERTFSRLEGVWNLSADQGNLGVLITTSLRLVWFASLAENFNVSLPYVQMRLVALRASKFGEALLVEATPRAGGFLLGFKIDPPEARMRALREILALHTAAGERPDFGVRVEAEAEAAASAAAAASAPPPPRRTVTEDVEFVEDSKDAREAGAGGAGRRDAFAAYYAQSSGARETDRPVVFSAQLGLAVEQPPAGITLEQLWTA